MTHEPEFSLYGDGAVIETGVTTEIYPGPAVPNLQMTKISEDAIQEILSTAREVGLFENGVDYGQPGITDVGTTSITITAGGATYEAHIYALGFDAGPGNLTMQQQQARAAIQDFVGKLSDLTTFQPGELVWSPYQFTKLAVFSTPSQGAPTDPNAVQPNRLEWPLGGVDSLGSPTDFNGWKKLVVSGADLAKLQSLLREATQITIWTVGDHEYTLYFRPLLPDE
jgi:hypothetical protein